ncbi:MAG: FAD-dependent oxidoreductase [Coriobacteriales bacterium]|nr:FAD-dependent oxidoreductase [Coriobacteriales bacterium]
MPKRKVDELEGREGQLSRRDFLAASAVIAAGAAAAVMLPGCSAPFTVPDPPQEEAGDGSGDTESEQEGSDSIDTQPTDTEVETADDTADVEEVVDAQVEPEAASIAPQVASGNWDLEADVVVVGAGSGMMCAYRAAAEGARVLCLEKSSTWGGASKESHVFHCMGSETQRSIYRDLAASSGISQELAAKVLPLSQMEPEVLRGYWKSSVLYDEGCHDSMAAMAAAAETALGMRSVPTAAHPVVSDVALTSALLDAVPRSVDLLASLGVEWAPVRTLGDDAVLFGLCPKDSETAGFTARANMEVLEVLYSEAVEAGADFMFNTPVIALLTNESGEVLGVRVRNSRKGVMDIRATAAVVLASGGMCNHQDLLLKYCPSVIRSCFTSSNREYDSADGIRMGLGVGALMTGWDCAAFTDGGVASPAWLRYLYQGDVQLSRQPWLTIDQRGDRLPYRELGERGPSRASILASSPGTRCWVIMDADFPAHMAASTQSASRKPLEPTMADAGAKMDRLPSEICPDDWREGMLYAQNQGYLMDANTLPELARKMGIDADVLQAAVDDWNEACSKGVDDELDFDPSWLKPIVSAPFFAMAVSCTLLATYCGLATTPRMEVQGAHGVIPGLYAVGSTMGGAGGSSSFGAWRAPGAGVGSAIASAYLAADAVLERLSTISAESQGEQESQESTDAPMDNASAVKQPGTVVS